MPPLTNVQRAYDHICQRILAGEFPPGTVVSEAALARQLGVSRTPVGEALRELAGAGLVEQVPRYGTIVRSIARDEMIELYELREGLEPHAVGLAAGRIAAPDVARLERLCQRLEGLVRDLRRSGSDVLQGPPLREFLAADMAFHTLLIAAAGNRRIARLVRDSHVLTELFGTQRLTHTRQILDEACASHAQILDAVRRGAAAAARAAAAEHVRRSLAHTLAAMDRPPPARGLAGLALPAEVGAELRRIESGLDAPETAAQPRRKSRREVPAEKKLGSHG